MYEGFAPEVAWVTHGGRDRAARDVCTSTSRTLFCDFYLETFILIVICRVYIISGVQVRWEKETRHSARTRVYGRKVILLTAT